MIEYPLVLPTVPAPRSRELTMMDASSLSTSPFTFQQQSVNYGGDLWGLQIQWPPMLPEHAHPIVAVLAALRGTFGTFTFPAVSDPILGTVNKHSDAPSVRGAHTAGERELRLKEGRNSTADYFKAGDIIQLNAGGAHIYKVLKNANTNASGQTTLDIWPRLRGALADGDDVITGRVRIGTWRLASNERRYSVNMLKHYGLTLACREAV